MINCTFPASADAACDYFLKAGSELEKPGTWNGREAERLGLSGTIRPEQFRSLMHNRTPDGAKLTPRDNDRRRCMLDITVSPSKSVAVQMALFDPRIRAEVIAANHDTMRLAETMMQTRVSMPAKRMRRQEKVATGSLLTADFQHDITRSRDPGFHIHNAVVAVTTHKDKRYSPEFDNLVRSKALLKAYFHANLAVRMQQLGYEVTPTKDAFELSHVPRRVIREFSRRHDDINEAASKRKIRSPKGRAAIAAYTRQKKKDDLKADKLFADWLKRLTPEEHKRLGSATRKAMESASDEIELTPARQIDESLGRLLSATSAVTEEALMVDALRRGVGSVTLEGLQGALEAAEHVLRAELDGIAYVTTREALAREDAVVAFARRGGIRIRRTKRGEPVETQAGEVLLRDADALSFDTLCDWVQKAKAEDFRLVLQAEKARLYSDKSSRGEPLVFLEDRAKLRTGQERPRPKLVQAIEKVSRQVAAKIMKQAGRLRHAIQEQAYDAECTRSAARQPAFER